MTKIFVTFTLFFFSIIPLLASNPWLKRPLRFVSADSVLVWGYDGRDCRSAALGCNKEATLYPFLLTQKEWKQRKQIYKQWQSEQSGMNVVGGTETDVANNDIYAVATKLTAAAQLFRMQGDAMYTDYAERAYYNVVMHVVNDSLFPKGSIERQLAANLLYTMPQWIYALSTDNDVYVNLYTNSTANISNERIRFSLDQITDMPLNGSVKLRFNKFDSPTQIRLHLRMPDWLRLRENTQFSYVSPDTLHPSLFVNGHEISPLIVDERGYVVIEREWSSLDEVYLDLPLQVQRVTANVGKPFTDYMVWQMGPLVYPTDAKGLYTHPQWGVTFGEAFSHSGFPTINVKLAKTSEKKTKEGATIQHTLSAYADAF